MWRFHYLYVKNLLNTYQRKWTHSHSNSAKYDTFQSRLCKKNMHNASSDTGAVTQ